MSARRDKSLRIARYLTGHTGIPGITYSGDMDLVSPFPYKFRLTTDRSLQRLSERVKSLEDVRGLPSVIRFDGDLDGPPSAWAVMRLEQFCVILKAHYDANRHEPE